MKRTIYISSTFPRWQPFSPRTATRFIAARTSPSWNSASILGITDAIGVVAPCLFFGKVYRVSAQSTARPCFRYGVVTRSLGDALSEKEARPEPTDGTKWRGTSSLKYDKKPPTAYTRLFATISLGIEDTKILFFGNKRGTRAGGDL